MKNQDKTNVVLLKASLIAKIVFFSVWGIFAILFWIVGMTLFLEEKTLGTWLMWGFCTAFPLCITIAKSAWDGAKKGAQDGANQYTATISSNSVTVSNHPYRGAFMGLITGLLAGIAAGPIVLPVYVIKAILTIITAAFNLKGAK